MAGVKNGGEVVKMKRAIVIVVAAAFLMMLAAPVYALPRPIEKLKGGAVDVIKSPLELGKYAQSEFKSAEFKPAGLLKGLVYGAAHMIKKAASGAVDIATFPVDMSK